jgi:uncharacterized membrane protein YtjA (UPF0391 family)
MFLSQKSATFAERALSRAKLRGVHMLKWALIFFIISIVAGAFGFTGISAATSGIARILFFIFVVIFIIFLVLGIMAGEALF